MPILAYCCKDGHVTKKFVRSAINAPSDLLCPICQKPLQRQLSAPNSASVVRVDNGVQAKAVEVNLDMVEKIREQSTKDFTQKD